MIQNFQKTQALAKIFLLAKTESEMTGLLHDLFTVAEISHALERARIFACLNDGLSQRETKRRSKAAIATITHGAKFFRDSALIISKIIASARHTDWWQTLFWRA
ncbi:hypothetical protein JXD20_04480 [Candidatus Peregrinibacteria bacterium]|nr:hypothetical protein [Candidatus Peregrinibacteria bacterium]